MKGNKKYIVAAIFVLFSSTVCATADLTPTQLVDVACPTNWKNIDVVINPNGLSWANTADKNAFLGYQDSYLMDVTKNWGAMDDRYANDVLTVASECVLRKNTVVDNYFNKMIDTTNLHKRINIVPFIMVIML